MIRILPVVPDFSPITDVNAGVLTIWLIVLFFSSAAAFLIADYSVHRFKTNSKKTVAFFVIPTVLMTILMLCFFGLTATTFKGIILFLILILSSFEDIRIRECDDYLHVLVLVAGFIGLNIQSFFNMCIAAIIVFAVIVGTVVISKGEIGGADIKMSAACAFLLGIRRSLLGLIFSLTVAVIVNAFKKEKKDGFPMIPYLAAGFMTAYFL